MSSPDSEVKVLSQLVCLALFLMQSTPLAVYRLADGFSATANPNGPWQIGFSATPSLASDQFRLAQYADTSEPIVLWHPAKPQGNGPGYYPYVGFNPTRQTRTTSANAWALRPGAAAMEGANDGAYSIVRFAAPVTGDYKVTAQFAGIHYRLSTTDVHVLHNDAHLFDGEIDGYGGDTMFHAMEGSHPAASWSGTVRMNAGDTISFAVGYGPNHTHYNDTTELIAEVERVTENTNAPSIKSGR